MDDEDEVLGLDRARREAMLAADVPTLHRLFAGDMTWVHATARVDTKAGCWTPLVRARPGTSRWMSSTSGTAGTVTGAVVRGATMKSEVGGGLRDLRNRYVIIWHGSRGDWQVIYWQSTAAPAPP
jgi:hypothetical protein